jgi:hypothetical protein
MTIPTIASPNHSWITRPVNETVCNTLTESNSAASSQNVIFKRQ